ncbi:type II secretion system protein GspM [Pseudomonas massiliensis]|uniref:type II secretion system protein GspM n=1 Tax=Pseudomonas massiliensis TaxID=522492 RepID=UPI00058AFC4E|nr:type II secretion system protein GspM [Pseudomonas massiliensis]
MARPLTNRERKVAALLAVLVVAWLAWTLLIDSWFSGPLRAMSAQAEQLREQQQRYARQLSQGPELQARLERARQQPAAQGSLLAGDDPSVAAAELMQLVMDQVKAATTAGLGCEVTQRMPMVAPPENGEPYQAVKVSLTLECAIEPLIKLFQALEYRQPYLFIDALSIHRQAGAAAQGGPGTLQVHLLVRGYLAPTAGEASPE